MKGIDKSEKDYSQKNGMEQKNARHMRNNGEIQNPLMSSETETRNNKNGKELGRVSSSDGNRSKTYNQSRGKQVTSKSS